MTVLGQMRKLLDIEAVETADARQEAADAVERAFTQSMPSVRAAAGVRVDGRKSYDRPEDQFASTLGFFSQLSTDVYWHGFDLDTATLKRIPVYKIVELVATVSPEMSKALSDFLLMGNPGFELKAFKPGSDTEDVRGTEALNVMLAELEKNHGSAKVVFNRCFTAAYLRGKVFVELVLAQNGRRFVDFATPDPAYLAFRRVDHPERGKVWQVGQWQGSEFVVLEGPTMRYMPVQPMPGKIEGNSPINPAIFVCVFLISLLHDLRRVIQQQGYPRLDIEIIFEKLKAQIPKDAIGKPEKMKAWADGVVDEVKRVYSKLKADDTYLHSDAIKVNQPVGALDDSSLGAVDGLIKAIERMATRALKTMPLNMATTDGVSEANANRQWEMYAALCKSFQQDIERIFSGLFQFALQGQGILARVELKFAELRAAELLRDAQVLMLLTLIGRALYDNGIISQDEEAQLVLKKAKADQPQPRVTASPGTPQPTNPTGTNPEPGSNRDANTSLRELATQYIAVKNGHGARTPTTTQLEETLKLFDKFAPNAAQSALEAPTVN